MALSVLWVMLDDSWLPGVAATLRRCGVDLLHEPDPVKAATRLEESPVDVVVVHARSRRLALQRLYGTLVGLGHKVRTVVVAPDTATGSGLEATPPPGSFKVPSRLEGTAVAQWMLSALGVDVPLALRALAWPVVSVHRCFGVHQAPLEDGGGLAVRLDDAWQADGLQRQQFGTALAEASSVDAPGVLRPRDVRASDPHPAAHLEAAPGRPLGTDPEHCAVLPLDPALDVVDAVLGALSALHAQGTVHAAVAPSSVWLPQAGAPQLMHVGVAALAERVGRGPDGTPLQRPWLAPEQLFGLPPVPQTDIYRAAQLLFGMLKGAAPFQRPEPMRTLEALGKDPLPALDLPPALKAFWEHCMARAPHGRPVSALDAQAELRRARA